MASLEEEIADLKVKIAGYERDLVDAKDKGDTAKEERLLAVIASRSETLNRLLAQQRDQAGGTLLFLEFYFVPYLI